MKTQFTFIILWLVWGAIGEVVPAPQQIIRDDRPIPEVRSVSLVGFDTMPNAATSLRRELTANGIKEADNGYPIHLTSDAAIPAEGYRLRVTADRAELFASDARGAYYAVATLKQLLHPRYGKLFPEGVGITDAPALGKRGILLFLDNESAEAAVVERLKELFRALADLKYNTLFVMFAGNIEYETRTFPQYANPFSKAQVRDLLATAEECELEVIPYFQALSHCPWILNNPENVSLLEDPTVTGWNATWCPENPATDQFFKDILAETVELFEPEYIHLGMDELGPFGQCPRCVDKPRAELLADEIISFHDFLNERGVKTIIWQDELLEYNPEAHKSSAAAAWGARELLPRDIVLGIWYYGPEPGEMSAQINLFSALGYSWIGAGFNSHEAINQLCRLGTQSTGLNGMIATLWHYAGRWSQGELRPNAAGYVVGTAESAWNPAAEAIYRPGYDPVAPLFRNWFRPTTAASLLTFTMETLPTAVSAPLPELIGGINRDFGLRIGQASPMVTLAENMEQVNIPSAVLADGLLLAVFADVPEGAGNQGLYPRIGKYVITFADGREVETPLAFNWNITEASPLFPAMLNRGELALERSTNKPAIKPTLLWHPFATPAEEVISVRLERTNGYTGKIVLAAMASGTTGEDSGGILLETPENFDYPTLAAMQKIWEVALPSSCSWERSSDGEIMRFAAQTDKDVHRITMAKEISAMQPGLASGSGEVEIFSSFSVPLRMGIYLGNTGWANYVCSYRFIQPGWNRIRFNFPDLAVEMSCQPARDTLSLFQLGIWLPADAAGALDMRKLQFLDTIQRDNAWQEVN